MASTTKNFRKNFPPISYPATQVAPRKGFFVIIAFSSNNFVNKNFKKWVSERRKNLLSETYFL
jgi:hypothetical protein